ncbi:MAG TPA: ferredoxin [Solirubrobacteraceae bacterium]|nr:ferredoxin [Solirubrobacteraceae bacterium]
MTCLPIIDESACLAHGDCEALAPDVFRVDDVATVIGIGTAEQLIAIAQACPACAISVVDEATGEQVYP